MSIYLKDFIDSFFESKIKADEFAGCYMSKQRYERDSYLLSKDENHLSVLSLNIFCLADMYIPDEDRKEYEFNEDPLRDQIEKLNLDC